MPTHTSISCTRRIEFDAAHRIKNHESHCKDMHGHRYVVEATFSAPELDNLGRVVDFSVIKQKLGQWINEYWDHNTILWTEDKELGNAINAITNQSIFYLPYNPTAENMAYYLFHHVCPELFTDSEFSCTRIRIYETPQCFAEIIAK